MINPEFGDCYYNGYINNLIKDGKIRSHMLK